MIIKIRIAHWRFTFTFAPVTDVTGVNSTLKDGWHIPMWDFDDIPLEYVEAALRLVQNKFKLSNIYILNTGKTDHYIAYCFQKRPWDVIVTIVSATLFVDHNFFKYGVYREHWTLRVTPKEGRKPKLIKILYSLVPESVNISELNSWVKDTLKVHSPFSIFLMHYSEPSITNDAGLPRHGDVSAQNMKHSLTTHQ
jgi:hypothetical protein